VYGFVRYSTYPVVPAVTAVADRLKHVRDEVDRIAGRPGAVTIVGVTKFQPIEKIREAIVGGLTDLGNTYEQDGESMLEHFGDSGARWHFVGNIQSRKTKFLTRYSCIQSLDRPEIARDLERRMAELGTRLDVLVEVNVGGEAQKSGITPESLPKFLEQLHALPHLRARGLMAMPPPLEVEARRPFFQMMRRLFEAHRELDCLSMGTSEDYRVAVEEGSTMIRLGTTLFGPRPPRG